MLPIFPVDYPFIRKGHFCTMQSFKQARLNSGPFRINEPKTLSASAGVEAAPNCEQKTKLLGSLFIWAAILAFSCFPAFAQQPSRSAGRTAPRPATTPTTTKPGGVEVDRLLASGQDAYQAGRFEEAISAFNRVMALSANEPRTAAVASYLIGNVNMTQKKFGNAEISYQRAIGLNPNYADAYNNLGEALGEMKQFPRAIEAFAKAIALDPTLLKARYNQAVTYDRMKNFRYSEFVFRGIIKSNPKYALAYDGLAVTLSKAGRAKEALPLHEKAIALSPAEPSYYFNYAISNLMIGNTTKAMEQQEKLKALDPVVAERLASVIIKRQM